MLTDEHAYMKAQIKDNLRLKQTDELLDIWQQANHDEWTDLAFEVVREILLERLGEIPAREPEEQASGALETSPKPEDQVPPSSPEDIRKFVRQQTYESLDDMDTDELVEIWQEADHTEWTDLAFEVVQQILMERIGEVPARQPKENAHTQAGPVPAPRVFLDLNPVGDVGLPFDVSFNLVGLRCPDCGKAISEQDRVCPHCGVDLEAPLDDAELQALSAEHLEKAQNGYDLGRDFKTALAECDLALELTPDSAAAHNLRGLILDALGKTGLAIKAYQAALRLDPGLSDARDNLADAEAELKARNS
jgi:tetratricopeptide (TPR) repeat protein